MTPGKGQTAGRSRLFLMKKAGSDFEEGQKQSGFMLENSSSQGLDGDKSRRLQKAFP